MGTPDTDVESGLAERWEDLNGWMSGELKSKWWTKLLNSYQQPHRKYHTLRHLHQMFRHYDQHKDSLKNGCACAYAIFFHDFVYDPKAKDNEEKSAADFRMFAQETNVDQSGYVVELIEATSKHCTEAHLDNEATGSDDLHFFLDFDVAILGAQPDAYDQYRKQIREEYQSFDDLTYNQERIKIPHIFATQGFRDSYEAKARENIRREVELLKQELTS